MNETPLHDEVTALLPARRGHFLLESGHHGDLWLDMERLCLRPQRVQPLADQIALRLAKYAIDVVCGPLVDGAFVALMVAATVGVPFTYSDRLVDPHAPGLFPMRYRIPGALRAEVRGKRVAIVNDVINAGSAVRGTFEDLNHCEAQPVAIGTIAVLGDSAARFAAQQQLALETLAFLPNELWTPSNCPLCERGVPLTS